MASQMCFGPPVTTEGLHNAVMGYYDPAVYGLYANSWFKRYTLSVPAPAGWHFVGEPSVHFVGPAPGESQQDAQDGFNWNRFDVAHDRFFTIQRTPNLIVCTCWAGSHGMMINLECLAVNQGNLFQKSSFPLNQDEISNIALAKASNEMLPSDLSGKIDSMVSELESMPKKENDICCNYYSNGDRYVKTSKANCDTIGGTVVDDNACAE